MVVNIKNYSDILHHLSEGPCTIVAGGTDIMVKKRRDALLLPDLSDRVLLIHQCESLQYIKIVEDNIHIGALTRLEDLLHSPLTPELLKDGIEKMASVALRHVATLGGNIGNASPAGDSLPILYVLNAKIVVESVEGIRIVPIEEFIIGPGQTTLKSNEVIKEIIVQKDVGQSYFKKVGSRKSDTISKISFAGTYQIKEGVLIDVRISFGAVYKTIVRRPELEQQMISQISEKAKNDFTEWVLSLYAPYIQPIDDQRSNKEYRKQVALNILEGFIGQVRSELD